MSHTQGHNRASNTSSTSVCLFGKMVGATTELDYPRLIVLLNHNLRLEWRRRRRRLRGNWVKSTPPCWNRKCHSVHCQRSRGCVIREITTCVWLFLGVERRSSDNRTPAYVWWRCWLTESSCDLRWWWWLPQGSGGCEDTMEGPPWGSPDRGQSQIQSNTMAPTSMTSMGPISDGVIRFAHTNTHSHTHTHVIEGRQQSCGWLWETAPQLCYYHGSNLPNHSLL